MISARSRDSKMIDFHILKLSMKKSPGHCLKSGKPTRQKKDFAKRLRIGTQELVWKRQSGITELICLLRQRSRSRPPQKKRKLLQKKSSRPLINLFHVEHYI